MGDKGRCLELMAKEVERITLVEVQKNFLSGDIDSGCDLLSKWEQYIELAKSDTHINVEETLASTIERCSKRLKALQNVLTALPEKPCVSELQGKLNNLEDRFTKTKPGSGGGTFEWVDSILVKCLREGSWLMLDNVNLCSPAVLDRLNALLEPGGELVLGERGVGPDGELVTVKPHPDFRIFMVMDPRHGEISRAMRNRTLEICLLGPEQKHLELMDLQAILNHIGITIYNHQRALLNVHDEMKNSSIGFEPITTNHLIKAAALTVQLAVWGPFEESLRSACSDVYIKSRHLTKEQQERSFRLLTEVIKSQEKHLIATNLHVRDYLDTDSATLNTLYLQQDSGLAQLRQKSVLFSTILKIGSKEPKGFLLTLRDLFRDDLSQNGSPLWNKKLVDVLPHVLLNLVCSLTENDVGSRESVVLSLVPSFVHLGSSEFIAALTSKLVSIVRDSVSRNCLTALEVGARQDLCWDLRRVSCWFVDPEKCDCENKTIALLHYIVHRFTRWSTVDNTSKNLKNMTVLEFSSALSKGKVTNASVSCPEVLGLSQFLDALDQQACQLLDSSASLSDDECCQLISAFLWIHRLRQVGQHKLFVASSRELQVSDEVPVLLGLHITWVKKWLLPALSRLLTRHPKRGESGKLPQEVLELCAHVSGSQPARAVSRRVRRILGQPLPVSTDQQAHLLLSVNRLEDLMDLSKPEQRKESVQKKVEFLMSEIGQKTQSTLVKALKSAQTDDDLTEVAELKELESEIPDLRADYSSDIQEAAVRRHNSHWDWEVPLWPLRGVIGLRVLAAWLLEPTPVLDRCVREMPLALPSQLAGLRVRLLSESVPVTSPRPWLRWGALYRPREGEEEEDFFPDERKTGGNCAYPLQCPLVSLYATALISTDSESDFAALRSHRRRSAVIRAVALTVWTSAPALASAALDYRNIEIERVNSSYSKFIHSLKDVVKSKLENHDVPLVEKQTFLLLDKILVRTEIDTENKDLPPEVEKLLKEIENFVEDSEEMFRKIQCMTKDKFPWSVIGLAWTKLGLIQLKLFSLQEQVDPVQKNSLKMQYCKEEREELERTLAAEQAQALILGFNRFPLLDSFTARVQQLSHQEERLAKRVAIRPTPNVYNTLYNEIQQMLRVVVRFVESTVSSMGGSRGSKGAAKEAQSHLTSIRVSMDHLIKRYGVWYPDVISPIVSAMARISHGLTILIQAEENRIFIIGLRNLDVDSIIRQLVSFPQPSCASVLDLCKLCSSQQLAWLLTVNDATCDETFKLAQCSLQELRNVASVSGGVAERTWAAVTELLEHLVARWRKQQEASIQKELQEGSFFVNKPRTHENLTEEEEDAIEMSKLFPTYKEKDFADLEAPSLEQKKPTVAKEDATDTKYKLSVENVLGIQKVHSAIVTKNTKAHWLHPAEAEALDFITPFAERFRLFSRLLDTLFPGCGYEMDSAVAPALCVGLRLARTDKIEERQRQNKHYDFYHDPNPDEVKSCIPVLNSVTKRVLELLEDWPEHPTLNQIMLVIERVSEFPATSPVSRFLTGLELLLGQLKEWEENAHSGVTLGGHAAAVTRLVLEWRRMELAEWRGCLEAARRRLSDETVGRWWFHLYGLSRPDSSEDPSQLASALEQFMESSNLAEFQTRLDMLYTFHCHCVNSELKIQSNVMWNVYKYYSQFSRIVSRRIKDLSQPVEKKLKDYVKIARWNDINYWAVKETIHKTHKTLMKYIREYEGILKQPARSAMIKLEQIKYHPSSCHVNLAHFSAPSASGQMEPETSEMADVEGERSLLSRERSLFSRARKLCKESMKNCPLPNRIDAIGVLIEELQDTSTLLNVEDVDRTDSKERQKSAARSILHRKRKALTDVFHSLAGLGLSYRAGLLVVGESEGADFTLHSPVDLQAALAQLDNRPADRDLLAAWTGCEEHFLQSVARLAQLKVALSHPHKDLGPAIIERCKGFTKHLMSLCHDQKKSMTNSICNFYMLRCLIKQLGSISPIQNKATGLLKLKNEVTAVTEDAIFVLSQFEELLEACPELPDNSEAEKFKIPSLPHGAEQLFFFGDENWSKVKTKLALTVRSAKKSKAVLEEKDKFNSFLERIQKTKEIESCGLIITNEFVEILNDSVECLASLQTDISKIKSFFKMESESDTNPMVVSLNSLLENITQCLKNSQFLQTIFEDLNPHEQLEDNVKFHIETLLNKVLFSLQEVYKIYVNPDQEKIDPKDHDEDVLLDSHLKEKIVAELKKCFNKINLTEVVTELKILLNSCNSGFGNVQCSKRCLPLLYQFSLLAEFAITQQVAALNTTARLCSDVTSLFVDLANKGFRVPEELIEEEEGEGAETSAGGMGLGEGEGQKDVSDQIESQDQLEDAKKPGEHDQEEGKDCKEEEKGVEMSDDFGGKLQDMEKKEDENGSGEESEDEEEPDKEMGDTDKGAETLDQQIWGGSDSEDEENEEGSGDKEEEQGDRGEQIGEKEMGAKDDDKTPQADDNGEGKEGKNEKKTEINEMDEPEVDDDQVDPYHGKHQPQPEPEALDLPDDLQLDDGDPQDKEPEGEEENPFDIDSMKEPKLPEEEGAAEDNESAEKEAENNEIDTSDEDEEGDGENPTHEGMDVEEDLAEKQEEEKAPDDGGAKDEDKSGEDPAMEEEKKEAVEEAKPSEDVPSSEPVPSAEKDSGSKDQVSHPVGEDRSQELAPEEGGAEGREEQGVGAAENQQEAKRGGRGQSSQAVTAKAPETKEQLRNRPGDSDEQRTLGDVREPRKKKLKTVNMNDDQATVQNNDEGIGDDQSAEMYQHIKEAKEKSKFDAQTLDAATEEQASEQKIPNKEDDIEDTEELQDDNDMNMDQDELEPETENISQVNPEKMKEVKEDNMDRGDKPSADGERADGDDKMEVDGEYIETLTAARGNETSFHTKTEDDDDGGVCSLDVEAVRMELESQLATWSQPPPADEASRAWERLTNITAALARDLSEQLRLVLEPTHASRLKGDYRSGKRINMRKIIPYIASQFRKDKIWLRRTKPAKREYQIVLAIDDSSSMADNHSKELAFESLAVVSRALTLLEAGDLSVLSFGDRPRVLHQLGEPFTEQSGASLLQQFSFEQQKTQVGALVDFATGLFARAPARRGVTEVARLLVIVSDGRGALNEGEETVRRAVRAAKQARVFMVFVIVDNPHSKDSILDIRLPRFSGGKLVGIVPYMDSFPFPYYLILRDINSLPSVLSDALRQWFELVTAAS